MSARPTSSISSTATKTKELFRDILARGNGGKDWSFSQSSLFLDFLAGNQTYQCTPWGNPTRTVFGWQKPCYLLGEGYAKTFKELMDDTEWDKYGVGNYEKCADCMVHCGFEATAVTDMIRHPLKALAVAAARRPHRGRDGAGHLARRASARRSSSSQAMSSASSPRSGPASPGPRRRWPRSSAAKALLRLEARPDQGGKLATGAPAASPGRPADPSLPSDLMPTRAAGGSVRCAASEMTRATANGRRCAPRRPAPRHAIPCRPRRRRSCDAARPFRRRPPPWRSTPSSRPLVASRQASDQPVGPVADRSAATTPSTSTASATTQSPACNPGASAAGDAEADDAARARQRAGRAPLPAAHDRRRRRRPRRRGRRRCAVRAAGR